MDRNSQIEDILRELLQQKPELRGREMQLRELLASLMAARDETTPDPSFAKNLRADLAAQAKNFERNYETKPSLIFFSMKNFSYVLGAIVLVAIGAVGATIFSKQQLSLVLGSDVEVNRVGAEAFGDLALAVSTDTTALGRGAGGSGAERSQSGGGSAAAVPSAMLTADKSMASPLIYPEGGGGGMPFFYNYKFVYKGEPITLPGEQSDVYRRVKGFPGGAEISSTLRGLNFGVVNLGSFDNLQLQSFSLLEDRDFGYAVYVDMQQGSISVSENWQKWQTPDRLCQDDVCFQQNRLDIGDIPPDAEVIAIAQAFLSAHNIPTDNYGTPVVQNYWRHDYELAADQSIMYIPDVVTVVYPLRINGQDIFDESGNPTGLGVNVNVRVKRVSGLWELTSQRYDASAYQNETDTSRILEIAGRGGFRNYYYEDPSGATAEVELGTPTLSYVKVWMYDEPSALGYELLVPSLIFPIVKQPENGYLYRTSVIVPLTKEVLDSDQDFGGPIPMPLPAVMEGVESSVVAPDAAPPVSE